MQSVQSNRTPPTDMRVRLRTEVNFGCPVYRSPFLAYHHFDPPWEPSHVHREQGMIALCSEHHNFADGGMYSADYLRKLKQSSPIEPPKGKLPWNAANAFISFGSNYCITRQGKRFSFRVDGKNVFSLRLKEDGYLAVNASICNSTNTLVCEVVENDILPNLLNLGDLRCSAQGKIVEIRSRTNEAYLSLKFDRIDENTLLSAIRPKWPEPSGPQWVHEMKLKGCRMAARIDSGPFVPGRVKKALAKVRNCAELEMWDNIFFIELLR